MSKRTLGWILAIFLGVFGLIGLSSCQTQEEQKEFLAGWGWAILTLVIIYVVAALIFFAIAMRISY